MKAGGTDHNFLFCLNLVTYLIDSDFHAPGVTHPILPVFRVRGGVIIAACDGMECFLQRSFLYN